MPSPMPMNVALIAAAIKIVVVIGYIMLMVPMLVWLERKLIADFQARVGPSRVGPFGLLQSFADGIKLVFKEALQPAEVDRLLYYAAPVVVMLPALSVAAVVPWGGDLRVGAYTHPLVIADLPVGFLFVLALTSLSVYGIVLSGWSSNNKYSLLGGLRSSAQMVSYELPMGLCVVAGLMMASAEAGPGGIFSLSLRQVVETQDGGFWNWAAFNWKFAFLGLPTMIAFYICGLAETNRAPFDLPEAETELIGGYHTEYGGLKWAMFFLGEYAAMLNVAAVTSTLFLGGWHAPYPEPFPRGDPRYALHGVVWFGVKVFAIIAIYIWIRATLPRIRYDRLMAFGWKVLLPATLLNVMVIATILSLGFQATPPPVLARQPELLPAANMPGAPPVPGAPPANAPIGSTPSGSMPSGNMPSGNTPPASGPAHETPTIPAAPPGNAPAANTPAGGNPPGAGR